MGQIQPVAADTPKPPGPILSVAAKVPEPASLPVPVPGPASLPVPVPGPASLPVPVPAVAPISPMPTTSSVDSKIPPVPTQCGEKKDLERLVGEIKAVLGRVEIEDWFADNIAHDIKDVIAVANDQLKKNLNRLASMTAQYDTEMDQANKLCVRTISAQIETVFSFKTLQNVVADNVNTNTNDLAKACSVLQKALAWVTTQMATILNCAENLKRSVTPDHDQIVESVKNVTEIIQSQREANYTKDKIDTANNELEELSNKIRTTIHADEDHIEAAGEEFRRCIYLHAFELDLGLARNAGRLDVVFDD